MKIKALLVGLLLLAVACAVGSGMIMGGNTKVDLALGTGADSRGQGDLAVANAQATAIVQEALTKAQISQNQAESDMILRDAQNRAEAIVAAQIAQDKADRQASFTMMLKLAGSGIAFALALAAVLFVVIRLFRHAVQPISAENEAEAALFFPTLNRVVLTRKGDVQQTFILTPTDTEQLMGDPTVAIAANNALVQPETAGRIAQGSRRAGLALLQAIVATYGQNGQSVSEDEQNALALRDEHE